MSQSLYHNHNAFRCQLIFVRGAWVVVLCFKLVMLSSLSFFFIEYTKNYMSKMFHSMLIKMLIIILL